VPDAIINELIFYASEAKLVFSRHLNFYIFISLYAYSFDKLKWLANDKTEMGLKVSIIFKYDISKILHPNPKP
jgi:hypothetical protein